MSILNPILCLSSRPPITTTNVPETDTTAYRKSLATIAFTASLKKTGSTRYLADWRRYSELGVKAIRDHLSTNLPHPVDEDATTALTAALGKAVDEGSMPSFEEPGARAGYALGLFGRARLLADLLFLDTVEPVFDQEENEENIWNLLPNTIIHNNSRCCNIVSLGGGPGYDFVAAALVASFQNECAAFADHKTHKRHKSTLQSTRSSLSIHATIYDYELGWSDLVETVSKATRAVLPNGSQYHCHFGGQCDITLPLSHSSNINTDISEKASTSDVLVCQYCVAENAATLRLSNFGFFRELFDLAKEESVIIFTETTHRIWPELICLLTKEENKISPSKNSGFQVSFPFTRRGRNGVCMVLRKRAGSSISDEHLEMCETFAQHQQMNDRRQQNGFVRQQRKGASCKQL